MAADFNYNGNKEVPHVPLQELHTFQFCRFGPPPCGGHMVSSVSSKPMAKEQQPQVVVAPYNALNSYLVVTLMREPPWAVLLFWVPLPLVALPFGIAMLGRAEPTLRQGFRLRRKRLYGAKRRRPLAGLHNVLK